jgi:predicted ATPase/DNA-binding CsgD family transcriptional regulator
VYFVRLAPLRDPRLVLSSITQGVGLPDSKGRPLVEHLADHLRDRKLLIVLDNFEHLLPAASVVAELLSGTRDLRIVVSSRSPLRVSGEQECPVPALALPPQAPAPPASVAACESVRLFAERAAAVVPGFAVDGQNAGSVAQIVCRLDGLPLAIELAAARVRLLSPEAIRERLEHSLGLLTGGSRDLPDRQQTLRATIEWSYDLLGDEGRKLLAACSVFRGGIDLAVIESVCTQAGIGVTVLDGLQELVDQSLLRQLRPTGTPRYLLLETIREFAAERLAGIPDQAARLRGAHAAAFLSMAGEAGRPLTGPGQKDWLERLDLEHNNLRAAIKAAGAAAARLLAEGRQMTLPAALEYALTNEPEEAWRTGPGQALTRREAEVAVLAARGLTNRDIAARLCLSVRTVEVHVDRILTKLGFRTRTQLAAWAHEEGLLAENT